MTADAMRAVLRDSGVDVSDAQLDALREYARLLLDWNARVNLISRKDGEMVWRNHILHSLAVCALLPLPRAGVYIDIGTGGGLPGIPLAILFPEARFTLVDSIAKKMRAVEDMAAALGLANVRCLTGRVEELAAKAGLAASADIVTARAVTELSSLVAWAAPLLHVTGECRLIAWKGGDLTAEAEAVRYARGVSSVEILPIALAGEDYFEREEKKIVEVRFDA